MESKDLNAIYSLMQNVSDKLETIATGLDDANREKKHETVNELLKGQSKLQTSITTVLQNLKNIKKRPTGDNINHHSYILFGNDGALSIRSLLIFLGVLAIIWFAFKTVAPLFLLNEETEKQNRDYTILYNYLVLTMEENDGLQTDVDELMNSIKNGDSAFYKDYQQRLHVYQKSKRMEELKKELEALQ